MCIRDSLSGVHVSGQTGHFPTGEGVTVLLVCGEAELLTFNVLGRLVVHGQGVLRLRHSIGAHFVLVANVVAVSYTHLDWNWWYKQVAYYMPYILGQQ